MGRSVKFKPEDMFDFASKVARFCEGIADLEKDLRLAEGVVTETWDDERQREFSDAVSDCSRSLISLHDLSQSYVAYLRSQAQRGEDYTRAPLPQK